MASREEEFNRSMPVWDRVISLSRRMKRPSLKLASSEDWDQFSMRAEEQAACEGKRYHDGKNNEVIHSRT